MARRPTNPIILKQNASIGKLSAEADDEFLFDCFVFNPALESALSLENKSMIVLARTGGGKTALLRKIEEKENTKTIDLFDMSMEYVANSDVIRFLLTLGIDLDLFFQALWKHVLCIEFIRKRYAVDDESRSTSFFASIVDRFSRDDRRKRAISYLREWEGKFWITADENIKELTQQLEGKISAELGGEIEKFKMRAGYERTLSAEKRTEISQRARRFVTAEQLTDLNQVLELLREMEDKSMKVCYLLIDRIDEKWVDESLRFRLIRGLIESLKSFRKISNLKIVLAMRTDVYERVLLEKDDVGFQREKYEDYLLKLEWDKKQLKELVDRRIRLLYRRKYTQHNVGFDDLFHQRIGSGAPFDFIVDRTLMRPRDVLSFVNECLLKAVGSAEIHPKHIKDAELEYSRIRLQAILDEWRSAYPTLETSLKMLSKQGESFFVEDIPSKHVDETAVEIAANDGFRKDPIFQKCSQLVEDHSVKNWNDALFGIIAQCYRVGAVGVKLDPQRRFEYSHLDAPILMEASLQGPQGRK